MAVLECKDLTKHYGAAPALDHVDLAVEPGRIVGLLGPNGSGKTTLIKLANGLLTPSAGEVLVCGAAPGKATHAAVSYLPERTAIPTWMSVKQLMDFYGDFYRRLPPGRGGGDAGPPEHPPDPADQADVQGHPGEGAAHHGHEPGREALPAG